MKDVATICCRCGCCSARGRSCPYSGNRQTGSYFSAAPGGVSSIPRGSLCACGIGESTCLRCGICRKCSISVTSTSIQSSTQIPTNVQIEGDEGHRVPNIGEEQTSDTDNEQLMIDKPAQRLSNLSTESILLPGRVILSKPSNDIKVASVSVGNYHTILLCADHQVFTFGSNNNGQLGTGNTFKHIGPVKVNLPANVQIVQAVAGANHCVLRTMTGEVITFGAYRAGQLGREADLNDKFWFAKPTFVPGFGLQAQISAGWVSAKGNRTTIQGHRRLLTKQELDNCQVTANRDCVVLFPLPGNSNTPTTCAIIPYRSNANFHQFPVDVSSPLR